jgi:hypothetical protein
VVCRSAVCALVCVSLCTLLRGEFGYCGDCVADKIWADLSMFVQYHCEFCFRGLSFDSVEIG